ncbi:MAG: 3-methyl-2-oxobutanoate dehydrogenase subunit VorB [Spirochaetes bacterium]|nr:3-methyl-2-oxobutanoate dehydrogenase subunit VorB [Spirochaetota bacterium]
MNERVLMKGNEAMAESAVIAGCRYYFGYPITPQNDVPEYMSRRMPEVGGVFLQAESEVAAINMVLGASASGKRVMTSSSSPGISLKQEGISYLAGCNLPAVVANITRAGPGLGDVTVAQSDYFQATRGGGHGDYRTPTLMPGNVQELADMTVMAFDIADKYRTPVMILADATIGQMMEPIILPQPPTKTYDKPWALTGAKGRKKNVIRSLWLFPDLGLPMNNEQLQRKYAEIEKEYRMYEEYMTDDADYLFVAYGTTARMVKEVIQTLRGEGIKAGLFRPKMGWPYPYTELRACAKNKKFALTVEMSYGQMVDDVRIGINGDIPVYFHGRAGGVIPTTKEIIAAMKGHM